MRGRTLAFRLALWFAVASAAVLGALGAYLYRSLEQTLVERDDADLFAMVARLRGELAGVRGGLAGLKARQEVLLHDVSSPPGLYVEMRAVGGEVLASSDPGIALPAPSATLATSAPPDGTWVRPWKGGRLIAAWASVGRPAQGAVMLVLGRDGSRRQALLAAYRQTLAQAVLAGAAAMALLGYAVARSGLRPVRAVARTAWGINANRLGQRLSTADAPAELAELVRAFNSMLERLDESFRRLAQFSSDLAHDLRTPVAALVSGAQVALSRRRSAEEYEALLASQLEEYERLNRLIEGMLFLARADHAQVAIAPERLEAQAELSRIAEYFAGLAEEQGVRLEVEARGALRADPVLFRRAVGNLVTNALRFTPSGGRIGLRGLESGNGTYLIEVSNSGEPIAPEHLPHLFERFYRVDPARSGPHTGSGLGLAIVASIMALHQGKAEAESRPGRDTVFRLAFGGG